MAIFFKQRKKGEDPGSGAFSKNKDDVVDSVDIRKAAGVTSPYEFERLKIAGKRLAHEKTESKAEQERFERKMGIAEAKKQTDVEKAAFERQKYAESHAPWKSVSVAKGTPEEAYLVEQGIPVSEKKKFQMPRIEFRGEKEKRLERERILEQMSVPERSAYLREEAHEKRMSQQFAEEQRTSRGVRRHETIRRLLKYEPTEQVVSKVGTAALKTMGQERALAAEQRLALSRTDTRRQVMPTAMQVISKTPFEQQAEQRAMPQERDYASFTQGVGMNIPSPIEGVGRDFGEVMRPNVAGRDYGSLFGNGGVGSRFGDLLRGPQQVQQVPVQVHGRVVQQAPVESAGRDYGALFGMGGAGSRFGDLLRGPQQAVPVQGRVVPKKAALKKRVEVRQNPFGNLLMPSGYGNGKKKNRFSW
jgi:hypothetical protein